MTIRQALLMARDLLRQQGVETPFLDAMVLLSACAGKDKAKLLASYEEILSQEEEECFYDSLHRRLSGLPVSYILRRKEFFGLTFYVDERVLVPRPETELMVETALRILKESPWVKRVHDACTGSGCVPISIAAQMDKIKGEGEIQVSASDISEEALEVFRINCLRVLGYILPHAKSDLLEQVTGTFHMITANPPYIPSAEVDRMKGSGWPEPRIALDGGEQGTDYLEGLAEQAMERLEEKGYLLLEGADSQAESIQQKLRDLGYRSIEVLHDLAGLRRVFVARKGQKRCSAW